MRARSPLTALALAAALACASSAVLADDCVDCHSKVTPGVVGDWKLSKHFPEAADCTTCHGADHHSAADVARARLPGPEVCGQCHPDRLQQFQASKHAKAWVAMNAMPSIHWQPMAMTGGMKGCGGCHKLGLKSEAEQKPLAAAGSGFGNASCDACHTRHTFSVREAREPQACMTCHMGFDHPQWEMYSSSKHGARDALKQLGVLPATAAAPTCQTCHTPGGDHAVTTAWGFLAVRLPMPDDQPWAADRATLLQGLGVLDPAGQPTARLEVVKAGDVARLDQASWQAQRDRMLDACGQCHSATFAREQLARGDDMIRDADHLMAEAIRIVAALYQDGVLPRPATYAAAFPDLRRVHGAGARATARRR